MKTVKTSAAAGVIHAVPHGRVLCGARAEHQATGGERPCKRCAQALERDYEPLPRTPDHWRWGAIEWVARSLNVNWGSLAHPVLLTPAERAEWEELLLGASDHPEWPGTQRWVRHMSDSALMAEAEERTAPARP